jgi:alkylated DNA repair dioxygenase AlkB
MLTDPKDVVCMLGTMKQTRLFEVPEIFPEGFRYQPELISAEEEDELLSCISKIEFGDFIFQGYVAKRRVVRWGYDYDFKEAKITRAPPIPEFLLPLREKAAILACCEPKDLSQALITEYPKGAVINWHRDAPPFERIVGISLLTPCSFRLRPYPPKKGRSNATLKFTVRPRSGYVMSGPAREEYQHSIAPVDDLRYSITFRTLRR